MFSSQSQNSARKQTPLLGPMTAITRLRLALSLTIVIFSERLWQSQLSNCPEHAIIRHRCMAGTAPRDSLAVECDSCFAGQLRRSVAACCGTEPAFRSGCYAAETLAVLVEGVF